jgi:class 3 adenylate cyclase
MEGSIWSKYRTFYLKCGINTGETLVGKINTNKRDQFPPFGSAVNLASRLGELTKKIKFWFQKKQKTNL